MRKLTDVGLEILQHHPAKFYIFLGSEYGIKKIYMDNLIQYYGHVEECDSVIKLMRMLSTKRMIPLDPSLYIIRYDDEFLSTLSDKTKYQIDSLIFSGTIICIYDQPKQLAKLDKYIPDYCVTIDGVSKSHITKYLHNSFSTVPDRLINIATNYTDNYGHAMNVCKSMQMIQNLENIYSQTDENIARLFGCNIISDDKQIRLGIAARNFKYLNNMLDNYIGDLGSIFYIILSTTLDVEKSLQSKYYQSDISSYLKLWKLEDVYNMFVNTYEELKKSRSSTYNIKSGLLYLFSLLQFSNIPAWEDLQND